MMINRKRNDRIGMTLVELLIVFAIIGILVGIIVPVVRLTNVDSKSSIGASSAEVFVNGVIRDGQTKNGSTLFIETLPNAVGSSKRLLKGRKRRNYRGEDESSYALRGPNIVIGGTDHLVFWFYNVNPNRIAAQEKFKIDGYDGWFVVHQRVEIDRPGSGGSTGVGVRAGVNYARPMVVAICGPEGSVLRTGSGGFPYTLEHHRGYVGAGALVNGSRNFDQKSVVPIQSELDFRNFATAGESDRPNFWPSSLPETFYRTNSIDYISNLDFPKFQNGLPVGTLKFEITQPPTINENEVFEFSDSVFMFLDQSGMTGGSSPLHTNESEFTEPSGWGNAVDPTGERFNPDSPFRAQFFPRIDFDSNGNIDRVFAPSQDAALYYVGLHNDINAVAGSSNAYKTVNTPGDIPKLTPFSPNGSLFFLVGEIGDQPRAAGVNVQPGDHWLIVSPTTSRTASERAEIISGGNPGISRNKAQQY